MIWRRTRLLDTPEAYWAYLRLYSKGLMQAIAIAASRFCTLRWSRRPDFSAVAYDIPPPPPDESPFVQQPAIFFGDPTYGFAPPPPISELSATSLARARRASPARTAPDGVSSADASLHAGSGVDPSAT